MIQFVCLIRALVLPPLLAIWTVFLSVFVILTVILRFPRSWTDFIVKFLWARVILFFSGAKFQLIDADNVPESRGFLYTFSHSSHFDVPILFGYSPKSFRFGAKEELFKIPFFGWAGRVAGNIPIARGRIEEVKEVYRQAEKRVANGEAFALAPEGGRRKTKDVAPFKSGPFYFAINAKMPIVPVVLCGVDKLLPNKTYLINRRQWTTKVYIKFLPPIETKDLTPEQAKEVRDLTREKMVEAYEELKQLPT